MKTTNQDGFSIIEGLLILVIIAIIGGTGWYVMKATSNSDKAFSQTSSTSLRKSESKTAINSLETYTNDEYGFSFKYPKSWKLTKNLQDGRGAQEGDVVVESPNGTKVHFGPNQGGKGGDCADDQANDQHTTRTCTTRKIYEVDKLINSSVPVYLVKASDTDPLTSGGKTQYFVYLSTDVYDDSGNMVAPTNGSSLGAFLGTYDDVTTSGEHKGLYVTVYIEGKDDDKNGSAAFFDTPEVIEATPILKSFALN